MLLVIDVGNTRVKVFVYEADVIVYSSVFLHENVLEDFLKIFEYFGEIKDCVLSSVGNLDEKVLVFLRSRCRVELISHDSAIPFKNLYATPRTLGVDRLVLAAGACLKFKKQNRLVIDAGTCITYDFINEKDEYLGGAISPGLRMRYESLHYYTAKLPRLETKLPDNYIGKTTDEAIHSGVINGFVNEINGFIVDYEKQFVNLAIIFTGGDSELLSSKIKNTIFVNPNFLIESLKALHEYISINK